MRYRAAQAIGPEQAWLSLPVRRRVNLRNRLWKPWYVWRPQQVVVRALRMLHPPRPGLRWLGVAWGPSILADPTKAIGRSILTTGVYDLAVSEILARLIRAGDTVIDAGAHIGYMTLLAGIAAGPAGTVISFEPHPLLFSVLRRNVDSVRRGFPLADTTLREAALGEIAGTAELVLAKGMAANDGIAHIATGVGRHEETTTTVEVETIDGALNGETAGVIKLDVEGAELSVLKGATRVLRARRVRHILFEDHAGNDGDVAHFLRDFGCRLYAIGWAVLGPVVLPIADRRLAAAYEAPSYLATFAPTEVERLCSRQGWLTLQTLGQSSVVDP